MDGADRPTDTDDSADRDAREAPEEGDSEGSLDDSDSFGSDETNGSTSDRSAEDNPDRSNEDVADRPNGDTPDGGDDVDARRASGSADEFDTANDEERTSVSREVPSSEPDEPEAADVVREASAGSAGGGAAGGDESLLYRFRHDREGALMWIREMLSSVAVVLLIGLILFGVSGVWPPMVAVESGSMEPNMQVGDLVFVTEPGQFAPDAAENGIGVVTYEVGQEVDYRTFGSYGSVVIYAPPGRSGSPIIHRAMFRVTEGENWYDRADERYHDAVDCESLANCPAPHDGYITLGDNNGAYDQASGLSPPVRAEWVNGVARFRVPYLGYIRLIATGQVELSEAIAGTIGSGVPTVGSGVVSTAAA